MAKKVLVTGGSGQDGYYLINLLRAQGCIVHAQSRSQTRSNSRGDGVHWHIGDLTDGDFLDSLVANLLPDEIYNLAAVSRPTASWSLPRQTAELNAFVPQQICELVFRHNPDCRVFQASSSEIFGDSGDIVQDEQASCVPNSPYGTAKLYAHRIVGAYRAQYGLHASTGILFNHESPRRPLSFVSQKIAYAAAAISLGLTESAAVDERGRPILQDGKISLGDVTVRRDFGFAGDYVEAMQLIVRHPVPDDYVVGTGEHHSIEDFCREAFSVVGRDWKDHVVLDPDLIRKVDNHHTCADTTKIRSVLNWRPKIDFRALVSMMVRAQMDVIRSRAPLDVSPDQGPLGVD